MASGGRTSRVPYGQLADNPRQFILAKYCPRQFVFKDPRNIPKDEIIKFCAHVRVRQDDKGVENAFRFLKYWDGKNMVEAVYGTSVSDERAAANALKAKEARAAGKRTKKSKGKKRQEPRVDRMEGVEADGVSAREEPTTGPSNTRPQVTNNRPQVTSDNSNIDPMLLLESRAMTGSVPLAMPAGTVIVNETEMQLLRPLGYQTLQSLNGPQEGFPLYKVPAAALQRLRQQQAEALAWQQAEDLAKQHQAIDSAPHSEGDRSHAVPAAVCTYPEPDATARPRRKRMANADAQTIQEGKKLVKSTRNTRSASKRGRQRK